MKTTLLITIFFFFCGGAASAAIFPDKAFSDSARGTTAAAFLKTPASARLAALGFAGAALRAPDALFYNPAGISYLPKGAFAGMLGYETLLENSARASLAAARGFAGGVLGLGAIYRYESGLTRYDELGTPLNAYESLDAALSATYGVRFYAFDAGFSAKYIYSGLYDNKAASVAADFGLILRRLGNKSAELAFFFRNLGLPMKLGSEAAPLPFELGTALSWHYSKRMNVLMEGRLPVDHAPYFILAGEYGFPFSGDYGLALRAALSSKNIRDAGLMGAFSAGFGLKFGVMGLDYAFVPYGELGVTHRFSMQWGFGSNIVSNVPPPPPVIKKSAEKLSLAVSLFDPAAGVSESQARQITDIFEAELFKSGGFKIIERTGTDFVVMEKKLAYSGLSQKEAARKLAKAVGAKLAVSGTLKKGKYGYTVEVRLMDAETGEQLVAASADAKEEYLFKTAAREAATALAAR